MRKLISLFTLVAFAGLAHAAPPSVESIETLLELTHSEKMLDSIQSAMDQMMRKGMADATKGQTLTPAQQRVLEVLPGKAAQMMREEMNWSQLRPLYVQIYQESFTQEEVDGLVAFYKSPAGVALVNKMPVVVHKSMSVMQGRMGAMMQKMEKLRQEILDEAKAAK